MDSEIRANIKQSDTWLRGLYMLLFMLIYSLTEIVIAAVVVFQFISKVITGSVNERLLAFGENLSAYVYQTMRFFTYNSEEKPFPFGAWPQGGTPAAELAERGAPPITPPDAPPEGRSADVSTH